MTTTNFDNHDIQQHILTILNSAAPIADTQLLSYPDRQASDPEECAFTEYQLSIKSALDSLVKKEIFLEHHLLTQEGHHLAQSGSHEYWVWDALGKDGLLMAKLQAKPGPDSAKIGQGKAFRNKRIKKRSDGGFIQAVTADQLITQTKFGRWKTATFKPYNLNTEGVPPNGGALHPLINVRDPLIKVREEFSNIFFGMGFIPGTGDGKYIKTSLWYFDSLFVPQQHPVQGSQDMSYLQDPVSSTDFPSEY
ncbi:hypothetical protein H4Q26_009398 [Puccinia striiformis f. sp. tritici PST-130]|nr:hypothetical protein H4Q26_009398 [Puccinia striiformis f. sp. tritici PST-130]